MYREGAVVIHQLDEVGGAFGQGDLQGEVVQGFNADLGKIGDLPGGEGLGVFHREQHVVVLGAHGRAEQAFPGPHVVVGTHGVTVGPPRLGIDMEGDGAAVLADIPALGHPGFRLQGIGVLDCQALEQGANDVVFRHPGHHVRVQALGLGTVAVVENTLAVARLDIGFAAATGDERAGECDNAEDAGRDSPAVRWDDDSQTLVQEFAQFGQ